MRWVFVTGFDEFPREADLDVKENTGDELLNENIQTQTEKINSRRYTRRCIKQKTKNSKETKYRNKKTKI